MVRPALMLLLLAFSSIGCGRHHDERGSSGASIAATAPSTSATTSASIAASASAAPTCSALPAEAFALPPLDTTGIDAPLPEIIPPVKGPTLDRLYEKLAALARGTAKDHVRIAVYGDSNLTMDGITGGLRRMLQAKLGDGGHGFVAAGKPWNWYRHMDVQHGTDSDDRWRYFARSTHPAPDRHFGFANIAAQSLTGGAKSWVFTALDDAPVGRSASVIEVFWFKQREGGAFLIEVDGKEELRVETKGPEGAGFTKLHLPDGPKRIRYIVAGGLPVRLFGTVLERDTPGIVIDSLGCGALNFEQMTRIDDVTRSPQIAERKYDLVIFLIGTNMFAPTLHQEWIHSVFASLRRDAPDLALMMMSPPDHEDGQAAPHTDKRIVALVKQWREIAAAEGAAYWDFWAAMGGDWSIHRLAEKKLANWDLVHLAEPGALLMGQRFGHALMLAASAWSTAHPTAGCSLAAPVSSVGSVATAPSPIAP